MKVGQRCILSSLSPHTSMLDHKEVVQIHALEAHERLLKAVLDVLNEKRGNRKVIYKFSEILLLKFTKRSFLVNLILVLLQKDVN